VDVTNLTVTLVTIIFAFRLSRTFARCFYDKSTVDF
jgi:hypothetical protein